MASDESIVAFAKLLGDNNFVYYMTTEKVTLGRHAGAADIVLGENKNISRCHAKISFNRTKQMFELQCMSKNGVFVDGEFIGPTTEPTVLRSKALVQIGPRLIYFLLPKSVLSSNSASDDDEGSDLSKSGPQAIRVTSKVASVGKKWSRTSRERVRCALMRYGYGRWDALSEALDDRDYTLGNLQTYASQLVQQLIENCDDLNLRNGLLDILKTSPVELPNPNSPEPSLAGWTSLQKNVKKWSTRLILLFELKTAIELFGESNLLDEIGPIKGRSLGPHWDRKEDLDLCNGIYRHGFGEFFAILNDETLGFKGKWISRQDGVKGDPDDEDDAVSQTLPETTSIASTAGPERQQTTNTAAEHNHDTDQNGSSLPEWPQHLALIGRLKRILDLLCAKRGKHAASFKMGKKRRDHVIVGSEDPKKMRSTPKKASMKKSGVKAENTLGWTRKDQAAFQRGIIAQGRPESWQYLRTIQPLLSSKTDQEFNEYFEKFMEAVDRVVVDRESADDDSSDKPAIADEALAFSFGVAVKIKERCDLFESIRAALSTSNEKVVEGVPPAESAFLEWAPTWSSTMDYGLLRAVARYGVGNWAAAWADSELPFLSSALTPPSDTKLLSKRANQLISTACLEFDATSQKSKYVPRNPNQRGEVASRPTYGPNGTPNMPLQVTSSLKIISLGVVSSGRDCRDGKHIFPIGFKSERDYPSLADPSHRCKYLCEVISENGRVRFRVTCGDLPDTPLIADKPTHVWKQIETRLDTQRSTTRKRSTINGMEKFGLNHPMVMSLLIDDSSSNGKMPSAGPANVDALESGAVIAAPVSDRTAEFLTPATIPAYKEETAPMDVDAESESIGEEEDEEEEDEEEDDEEPESSDIEEEDSDHSDEPGPPFSEP